MAALADPQRRPPGLPQYNLSQVVGLCHNPIHYHNSKSSAKDSTPLVLKLQYAKYRGPLRGPRRNRLLRHHYPADGSFAALPGRTAGPRPQGHGQGVCKDCAQDPLSDLHAMVREFAKTVHSKGGKVVFVNFTKPPESSWGTCLESLQRMKHYRLLDPLWQDPEPSKPKKKRDSGGAAEENREEKKKPPAQNPVALRDTKPLQIPVEEKVAPSLFDTVVEAITHLCGLGSTNPRRPHPRPPPVQIVRQTTETLMTRARGEARALVTGAVTTRAECITMTIIGGEMAKTEATTMAPLLPTGSPTETLLRLLLPLNDRD
ncbi:hypothetical protein TrVFT333_002160 [Trichoderma virens FT-333]|nr:hypothetical protein TrVFT333_002160 [Trichoderma virens FT-333]